MVKCSYCTKKSIASCGFIRNDGEKIDIQACRGHFDLAMYRQKSLAWTDNLISQMEHFNRRNYVGSDAI